MSYIGNISASLSRLNLLFREFIDFQKEIHADNKNISAQLADRDKLETSLLENATILNRRLAAAQETNAAQLTIIKDYERMIGEYSDELTRLRERGTHAMMAVPQKK